LSDTIRAGFISAINYEEGTAQVVYKDRDEQVSPYLPFWSNEYNMPDIDTLVYVVHLQNGSTKGMILIPPFTNEHPPVEGKKGIWRKDFGDGSYLRYDYETLHLDIVTHSVKIQQLEIEGDLTVGGEVDITGNVHIKGHLTVDGGISG
jgi:phage baseplate assembly protein gpV